MEYYLAIKKEILSCNKMDTTGAHMLSEISQFQKTNIFSDL